MRGLVRLEVEPREFDAIIAGLVAQLKYFRTLADRNKDEEALGRNVVNATETRLLIKKLEQQARGKPRPPAESS